MRNLLVLIAIAACSSKPSADACKQAAKHYADMVNDQERQRARDAIQAGSSTGDLSLHKGLDRDLESACLTGWTASQTSCVTGAATLDDANKCVPRDQN